MELRYDSRTEQAPKLTDTAPVVPPVVVPPIVMPPPSAFPVINLQPFTASGGGLNALTFWRYTTFNRYERNQTLLALPQSGGTLRMIAVKMFDGTPLNINTPVAITATPMDGSTPKRGILTASTGPDVTAIAPTLVPGWHRLTATATPWQIPAYYAYVPGGPPPTMMPVVRANWEMEHPADGIYTAADCMVPAVFAPTMVPYPARTFDPLTSIPSRLSCVETQLVPCRAPDVYRLNYASTTSQQPEGGAYTPRLAGVAGVATTANRQCYNYFDLIGREVPMLPLLDGPRGKGNLFAAQHLAVARGGKILFNDNWRHGRIGVDGTIKTLVGWRHKTPTLWTDLPQDLELVGDWSGVDGARSINESWASADDPISLEIDLTVAAVGGEPPHKGVGPRRFLPDRGHNRILACQFNGGGPKALPVFGNSDRDAPAIVTEWVSCKEPWACVAIGQQLYVSERGSARIAAYDMANGALLSSFPMPVALPFPEGLAVFNGDLYYVCVSADASGQLTGGQIRKRTPGGADSLHIQMTTPWIIDNNSRFGHIAISTDATFGPPGMLSLSTWSGNNYGYPLLFMPDGSKVSDSVFPGNSYPGPGLPWNRGSAYPTASAFGQGRMVCSTMQEGLRIISKAQATDKDLGTPGYLAGRAEYLRKFYNGTNGDNGWGLYGLPSRMGESAQMDEYLRAQT